MTAHTRAQDLSRRGFFAMAAAAAGGSALFTLRRAYAGVRTAAPGSAEDVTIVEFSDAGARLGAKRVAKVVKPEAEWRAQLSKLAFEVTRHGETERPFSGTFWDEHRKGLFRCGCCGTALFSSSAKFDSGTGWPSFWEPIADENVHSPKLDGFALGDTDVKCRRCDAHLGDLFDDGPKPTGLRYCIDSVSLKFVPA